MAALSGRGLVLVVVMFCVSEIRGQVRLTCPRPRSANSHGTQGPCGAPPFSQTSENYMDVEPGPLTVRWEDTQSGLSGNPSRLALGSWESDDLCVLLDMIPHRDGAPVSQSCSADSYPVGSCQPVGTAVTVQIPNINCNRCFLQLMSVDTQISKNCIAGGREEASNCTTYFSCASIRIRGNPGAPSGLSSCQNTIAQTAPDWPVQAFEFFKTIDFEAREVFSQVANFEGVLTPLNLNLPSTSFEFRFRIEMAGPRPLRPRETSVWVEVRGQKRKLQALRPFTLSQSGRVVVTQDVANEIRAGKAFFRFRFNFGFFVANRDTYLQPAGKVYGFLSGNYNEEGWLTGSEYTQGTDFARAAVTPAGDCGTPALT